MNHDPIEDDPKVKPLIEAAEIEAEKKLEALEGVIGYCHAFWALKRRILKDKYGIEWRSPSMLNPGVKFD